MSGFAPLWPRGQVAVSGGEYHLGSLQLVDVVPAELAPPRSVGVPVESEPHEPVAHSAELSEQRTRSGHDRADHGSADRGSNPDVVHPTDVVAVAVNDSMVDQIATDVHA
jgi:hypothetical protein